MNKAFTLIELLAVIVILAIIALIAVPIVLNIVEDTNNSSNKVSLDSIERAAYLYNMYNEESIEFKLKNGNLVSDTGEILKLNGDLGEDSGVKITSSGNIYAYIYNNGYCTLRRGNDHEVEQFKTDKELCNMDVATNLVVNGYGEYKDNTNFDQFTYEDGTFKIESSNFNTLVSDEYIKIDPNKKYYEEVSVKTNNTEAIYYAGMAQYDIDKKSIGWINVFSVENTLTYLTRDLKNGDMEVYLNDVSNYISAGNAVDNLIFWNYKDSTGYEYPELTYSRNSAKINLDTIDKENNKIELKEPWRNDTLKAKTMVSQSSGSWGYNFGLYSSKKMTTEYQTFSNTINEVNDYFEESFEKFRNGTKYIKFLAFDNNANQPNVITHYKNIVIREID